MMSSTRRTSATAVANQAAAARVVEGEIGEVAGAPVGFDGSTVPVGLGEVPASGLSGGVLSSGVAEAGLVGLLPAGSTSENDGVSDAMAAAYRNELVKPVRAAM
jgi:hypothetical protein